MRQCLVTLVSDVRAAAFSVLCVGYLGLFRVLCPAVCWSRAGPAGTASCSTYVQSINGLLGCCCVVSHSFCSRACTARWCCVCVQAGCGSSTTYCCCRRLGMVDATCHMVQARVEISSSYWLSFMVEQGVVLWVTVAALSALNLLVAGLPVTLWLLPGPAELVINTIPLTPCLMSPQGGGVSSVKVDDRCYPYWICTFYHNTRPSDSDSRPAFTFKI